MQKPLATVAAVVIGIVLLTSMLPADSTDGSPPEPVAFGEAVDDRPPASPAGRDVVVSVVGQSGAPRAGVTVVFLGSYLDPLSGTWPRVATDATGVARISLPPSGRIGTLKVCPVIHGTNGAPVEIALPQQAPARIVIPPTGSLEIELVGPDGRPWTWPTGFECPDSSFEIPLARAGRLVLPHVSLGRRFRFSADVKQAYGIPTTTICGPTLADGTVRRRITVDCYRPHLTGRVLDPKGHPVTGGRLGFQRVARHGERMMRGSIRLVRATEGGRFLLALREDWEYRKLRVHWRMDGRTRAIAELPLHGRYAKTLHHLDNIRLEPAVLLARGTVTTASGAPLKPVVRVELHNDAEHDRDGHERRLEDRPAVALGRSIEDPADDPAGRYHEVVDSEGRFEIHGAPLTSAFTLRARGSWYSETDRPNTAPGAEGVRFVLSRAGKIPGRLRVSPGVRASDLRVSALTVAGRILRSTFVHDDGYFILFRMPAGLVHVAVFEPGADQPVALIRKVRVPAGQDADDERLAGIDLRGALQLMTLRVVDPSGRPIPGATTFGRLCRHDGRRADANGKISFLASEAPLPCVVRAPGFRPRRVQLEASETVSLLPGIPVRIHLDLGLPIPPGLTAQIYFNHEEARSPGSGSEKPAPINANISPGVHHVDLLAEAPGKHTVSVFFETEDDCVCVEGPAVVIRDRAKRQEFYSRLDPEQVRKAIERVSKTSKVR